jgi:hypothetical protein
MPSAKLQADRQVIFLRRYLGAHAGQLLEARKRASFEAMPIDVLVAISDGAVIVRPEGVTLDYLCKAEQVPERVTQLLSNRQPKDGFLGLFKDGVAFGGDELAGITSFLRNRHTPLEAELSPDDNPSPAVQSAAVAPEPSAPATSMGAHTCRHCQGERLEAACKQARVSFKGVHALRHAAGTRLREATQDLALVPDHLRYSSLDTARGYAKASNVQLKKALGEW